MNSFCLIFIFLALSYLQVQAQRIGNHLLPPIQVGTIDCSKIVSLGEIFDAGLRPYITTSESCRIGNSKLNLVLSAGTNPVLFETENLSFTVNKYDNLSAVDIRTQYLTKESARNLVHQVAAVLKSEVIGLDPYLDALQPVQETHKHWEQFWKLEDGNIFISIKPTLLFSTSSPKARSLKLYVNFSKEWKSNRIGPTFRETPIKPPTGYEHISMDLVTTDFLFKAQTSDDPGLAHLKYPPEVWTPMLADRGLSPSPTPTPLTPRPSATPKSSPVAEPLSPSKSFPWLFALTATAVMIALLWLLKRLRSKV